MLLNPNDFNYEYYNQPRGREGDSGPIYYGEPRKPTLSPILVKSFDISDAINEFVGCNVGRKIGINTPQAWLFKPYKAKFDRINFAQAVAIEYLEGLDDKHGPRFDDQELAAQTIKGILLHKLMNERDGISLAYQKGKIYSFDFAEGMLPERIYGDLNAVNENGFTGRQWMELNWEIEGRKAMWNYLKELDEKGKYGDLAVSVYMDLKTKFIEQYNNDGFSDLLQDVKGAFNAGASIIVEKMIDSMQQALIAYTDSLLVA